MSAYIDYAQRLKTEDLDPVFECKKKLLPRPSDLSFYNWETQTSTSNGTPNFQVSRASIRSRLSARQMAKRIFSVLVIICPQLLIRTRVVRPLFEVENLP